MNSSLLSVVFWLVDDGLVG